MSIQNISIKAGELICFSSGEYSDYSYRGHFVGLQDVQQDDMNELVESVKEDFAKLEEEPSYYGDIRELFTSACIKRGWLLCIDCREIHIGSYGELELA